MDWYILAIFAVVSYGIQNFLFKVSAEKKCNSAWTLLSFQGTVAVISTVLFLVFALDLSNTFTLLLWAIINSTTFFAAMLSRIESLKHIPTNVAYPIIRMSTVFVVLFSLFFFKDNLSTYQGAGIVLAILTVVLLTGNGAHFKANKKIKIGLILVGISLIFSVLTNIAIKFGAMLGNTLGLMCFSGIFCSIMSFGFRNKMQNEKENPKQKNALIIGFFIGVANVIGFYVLLKALEVGPLSIVASINSLYYVIAVLLSAIFFKEKMTLKRILALILSIIAVVLLGM
ncbi:MAG: DMT family transporter [Nanoarchaeota archaeon]|nr:DMT family transporter [Nanoarchaeota archaeon]